MAETANFTLVFILPLFHCKKNLNPFFLIFNFICINVSFSLTICLISLLRQNSSVPLFVLGIVYSCLFLYYAY